jgi:uncharacterized protein
MDSPLSETTNGTRLRIHVYPRSSQDAIGDFLNGELKIRLTAPPVDSAANNALRRFLAKKIGCPQRDIVVMRGEKSRHKLLEITGLPPEFVAQRLKIG